MKTNELHLKDKVLIWAEITERPYIMTAFINGAIFDESRERYRFQLIGVDHRTYWRWSEDIYKDVEAMKADLVEFIVE